ncbi:MAG: hypothetical protein A2511_10885 [Deltaproteobacteria bacterium RIFOXYD12_FULL_50_9]|nr:MAG: hypothetical protein A2511_10885 [Deltaproteobacteria bacterium RIFOXYD12_FULL_50_9]
MIRNFLLIGILFFPLLAGVPGHAEESTEIGSGEAVVVQASSSWLEDDPVEVSTEAPDSKPSAWIDPLEPVNRALFTFNDRVYLWVVRPVVTTYSAIVPVKARICVRNAFQNLFVPIRLVNNVLQGKFVNSGVELGRFVINSTVGVAGLFDPAREYLNLLPSKEDFGQTLGVYGIGDRIYLFWPFLGPSTLRDTLGLGGDYFLNPLSCLAVADWHSALGAKSGEEVNRNSLSLGEYEKLKAESFDFYVAVRDGYLQLRQHEIAR